MNSVSLAIHFNSLHKLAADSSTMASANKCLLFICVALLLILGALPTQATSRSLHEASMYRCGWAFSDVAAMEGITQLKTGKLIFLSVSESDNSLLKTSNNFL